MSFIFSGVILLISKYKRNSAQKTKKLDSEQNSKEEEVEEDEQNSNNIEQIEIIHQKLNKKRKKKSILYLISLSFLGILSYSGRYLFQIYFKENYAYSSHSIRTFFEMANIYCFKLFFNKSKIIFTSYNFIPLYHYYINNNIIIHIRIFNARMVFSSYFSLLF